MKSYLVQPYGVCPGVNNAIDLAIKTRMTHLNEDVSILGMIVHNESVIDELNTHNIKTYFSKNESLSDLLKKIEKGYVIFTAHGHAKILEEQAKTQGLKFVDATCPQVSKVFNLIEKANKDNQEVIYIGKKEHPETNAALSHIRNGFLLESEETFDYRKVKSSNPIILNQTTFSFLDLKNIHLEIKKYFPKAIIYDEICNTTRIRQEAVLKMPQDIDLVYVIGGSESSNTARLAEIATTTLPNAKIKKIITIKEILNSDLDKAHYVGIIAGASTPLFVTQKVINYINNY